jgi:multiple antibiotic resistance protein
MEISLINLASWVFIVIGGILPVVNPFSTAPLFVSLTKGMAVPEQDGQANRACIFMAIILLGSFFLGTFILEFFGISIPAIRVAGGLIISYIGSGMLFPREQEDRSEIVAEGIRTKDFAFTPLAMPMLSGPGSIAVVLEMSAKVAGQEQTIAQVLGAIVVSIGILITVFVCWLVLRSARKIVSKVSAASVDALTKIFGFLLICIGIQFAAGGVIGFIQSIPQ